jgi:UDP-glucose 4-epimerase
MNKVVLVTGGAGYIGGHASLALMERGEKVVVLDDLSESDDSRVPKGATFVKGSIGDAELVKSILREHEIDAVLHFAGFIRVDESVRDPEKYFTNNTTNTQILAKAVSESGVTNFIYSSSAAVYGNPEKVPVQEDDAKNPINPYGESKLRSEKILLAMPELRAGILRYFNVAGVDPQGRAGYRHEPHPTHMIRSAVRALLEGRSFVINGSDYATKDGTCVRDYIHVSDLALAHINVLDYLRSGGSTRIYNCGDGHGYSNLEVVKTLSEVAGKELPFSYGPRRDGDPAELIADASRIRNELGWTPKYGLRDMIQNELDWAGKN